MHTREYIELDDYQGALILAEGKMTPDDAIARMELPIGELIVSDVILALREYMPEVQTEWVKMLFSANSELNYSLTEEGCHDRIHLGWMYANLVVDLHKKTGNA